MCEYKTLSVCVYIQYLSNTDLSRLELKNSAFGFKRRIQYTTDSGKKRKLHGSEAKGPSPARNYKVFTSVWGIFESENSISFTN